MKWLLAIWLSAALTAQDKALDCATCHDTAKKIGTSIHNSLTCDTCHDQHKEYPHKANHPKPACATCHPDQANGSERGAHAAAARNGGAAPDCATCHGGAHEVQKAITESFRKAVPDTCGMCHSDVAGQFKASRHGVAAASGNAAAPVCTDCHGEHAILARSDAASPVHKGHIRETCARCHADVRLAGRFGIPADRVTSFDASFHGLAGKGGSQTVANCASCHGFHNILASSDPKSMTHPRNLASTCGQCHPGAGTRFEIGTIHFLEGGKEPGPVRWVRLIYWVLIPVTCGLMFLHHFGDWLHKLFALRFHPGAQALTAPGAVAGEIRMFPFERIQHALLAVSFIVLGWTGFALKYPDAWWALPLVMWESSWPVRGTVHRIAAAVFVACGVMHFASLIVNRPMRHHWRTLLPAWRDVREGTARMAYNLGLRRTRPEVSAHSYVEKVEYWAVVWGALVMGISGFLLWFNNWSLERMPKAWLDVATAVHFYEAVLACVAVLIWHSYTVIFDPEVYPMDTAWLTGRTVRKRPAHGGAQSPASDPAESTDGSTPDPEKSPGQTPMDTDA